MKKKILSSFVAVTCLFSFSHIVYAKEEITPNTIVAYFDKQGKELPSREGSYYYRYFIEQVSGCYLAQDFYSQNDQKQTDPICFMNPEELNSWFPESNQGPLTFWRVDGTKSNEGYVNQGKYEGTWVAWDEDGESKSNDFINGEAVVTYFDANGNIKPTAEANGFYRVILDYDAMNDKYQIADYYNSTKQRQMDAVFVDSKDLFRWDIRNRTGLFKYYDEEGNLRLIENYLNGKLDGPVTVWYENVYPLQKEKMTNYTAGKAEGLVLQWYTNGILKTRADIKNGIVNHLQCWDRSGNSLDSEQCQELMVSVDNLSEANYTNIELQLKRDGDVSIETDPVLIPNLKDLNAIQSAPDKEKRSVGSESQEIEIIQKEEKSSENVTQPDVEEIIIEEDDYIDEDEYIDDENSEEISSKNANSGLTEDQIKAAELLMRVQRVLM